MIDLAVLDGLKDGGTLSVNSLVTRHICVGGGAFQAPTGCSSCPSFAYQLVLVNPGTRLADGSSGSAGHAGDL
jgi:hypothetical protein